MISQPVIYSSIELNLLRQAGDRQVNFAKWAEETAASWRRFAPQHTKAAAKSRARLPHAAASYRHGLARICFPS
jgi:hypothetical protein